MRASLFASGCAAVLLAACAKPSPLPPATVLENAVRASTQLQSASFALHAKMTRESSPAATTIDLKGRIQDGGRQIDTEGAVTALMDLPNGSRQSISARGEVIAAAENEIYLRMDELSSEPELPYLSNQANAEMLGAWWRLPSQPGAAPADGTPDPYLLTLQTAALVVSEDHGVTEFNGRDAYRYDVTIDAAKLREFAQETARQRGSPLSAEQLEALSSMSIRGEARIDAVTFDVLRLDWTITDTEDDAPSTWTITMDITDQNTAPTIAPPSGAQPLEAGASLLLRSLLPQGSIPDTPVRGSTLSPDAQKRILDSLQNGTPSYR